MIERILSDNFHLLDLKSELAVIRKDKSARRALLGAIRAAATNGANWPSSGAGRAALVLYLLDNPNFTDGMSVRWRHRHDKPTAEIGKPSGFRHRLPRRNAGEL